MSQQNKTKIAIIGCTHAGTISATLLSKYLDLQTVQITIFERNDNISYLSCGTHLAIINQLVPESVKRMFYNSPENMQKHGVNINISSNVINVDYKNKVIKYYKYGNENEILQSSYDYLLIACGSRQFIPPTIPGINYLDKVKTPDIQLRQYKTYDGIQRILLSKNYKDGQILAQIPKQSKVVFIGGGHINVELAWAASTKECQSIIIERGPHVLLKYYEKEIVQQLMPDFQNHNIIVAPNSRLLKIDPLYDSVDVYVESIQDRKIKTLKFNVQYVIIGSGFIPNTETLLCDELKNEKGVILTNEFQETSIKNVFAAGDCCGQIHTLIPTLQYSPLATHAVKQSVVASLEIIKRITGKPILDNFKTPKSNGTCSIQIFDWSLSCTGLTYQQALKYYPNAKKEILTDQVFNPQAHITFDTIAQNEVLYNNQDFYDEVCDFADEVIESSQYELDKNYKQDNKATNILIYDSQTYQILGYQVISKTDIAEFSNIISWLITQKKTIYDLLKIETDYTNCTENNQDILSKLAENIIMQNYINQ